MRIYSKKSYVIISEEEGAPLNVISGEHLREHLKLGDLMDGDQIYEATWFAAVQEKREIVLVGASGLPQPVEMEMIDEQG